MKIITAKEAFGLLEANCDELVRLQAKLKSVEADIEQLEAEIRLGADVSFFWKDVAIGQYHESWRGVEGAYGDRRGKIYKNAYNGNGNGYFGAHLHSGFPMRGNHVETWLGAYWKDPTELREVILDFIVSGKIPTERKYNP